MRTDVLDFDGDGTNDLIVYARQGSSSYINCITPNGEMLWNTSDTLAGNGFSYDKALLRCNNTTMLLTANYSTAQVQFTLSNPISGAVLADTTVAIDEGVPNGSDDFIGPFQFASFNPAQCMYWCYN